MPETRKFRLSASFWEATRIALDSLRKNKLRSFLTLLGIILATTTLIAVTALIHGMNLYIAEKVSNMGSDGFRVVRMAWFGPFDPKKFMEMQKRNPQIRVDEYQFVKERATLLKDLGMMTSRNARVSSKGESVLGVEVQGVTDNIPAINNVQVDVGRGITYEEVRRHAPVVFLGNDLRNRFFEGRDPIGKFVEIEGKPIIQFDRPARFAQRARRHRAGRGAAQLPPGAPGDEPARRQGRAGALGRAHQPARGLYLDAGAAHDPDRDRRASRDRAGDRSLAERRPS